MFKWLPLLNKVRDHGDFLKNSLYLEPTMLHVDKKIVWQVVIVYKKANPWFNSWGLFCDVDPILKLASWLDNCHVTLVRFWYLPWEGRFEESPFNDLAHKPKGWCQKKEGDHFTFNGTCSTINCQKGMIDSHSNCYVAASFNCRWYQRALIQKFTMILIFSMSQKSQGHLQ